MALADYLSIRDINYTSCVPLRKDFRLINRRPANPACIHADGQRSEGASLPKLQKPMPSFTLLAITETSMAGTRSGH
jgi:hypothetical protein